MKIKYIITRGVARWAKFDPADKNTLTITCYPKHNGSLIIDGHTLKFINGEVTMPTSLLKDGTHYPILECDRGFFTLDEFTKNGTGIVMPENASEVTRELLSVCHNLKVKVERLEDKIDDLMLLCYGNELFKLEGGNE